MRAPVNLAARPFRNERLPTLLLGLACLLLVGLTVRHAFAIRAMWPGRASDVDREVMALDREIEKLRGEAAELSLAQPQKTTLEEWEAVRALVDRRAFAWTRLFATLEEVVPAGVRLVSITPKAAALGLELDLTAVGREAEDHLVFFKALQARPEFEKTFLTGVVDSQEGGEFSYTLRYRPAPAGGAQ